MGNRSVLGAALAGVAVLVAGVLLGTVAGNENDPEKLGNLPTEFVEERAEAVSPVPPSAGVPPLKTVPHEAAQPAGELEPAYTPEQEYVPPVEEKSPYIPPPGTEPTPEITVGKNE